MDNPRAVSYTHLLEEVVQHVAMSVELQETLRVLRFCGGALGCAVRVQPGYHADLACLLVTDYQHEMCIRDRVISLGV